MPEKLSINRNQSDPHICIRTADDFKNNLENNFNKSAIGHIDLNVLRTILEEEFMDYETFRYVSLNLRFN